MKSLITFVALLGVSILFSSVGLAHDNKGHGHERQPQIIVQPIFVPYPAPRLYENNPEINPNFGQRVGQTTNGGDGIQYCNGNGCPPGMPSR